MAAGLGKALAYLFWSALFFSSHSWDYLKASHLSDTGPQTPQYQITVENDEECDLLCAADESCKRASFTDAAAGTFGMCKIVGDDSANGLPTPEGAHQSHFSWFDGELDGNHAETGSSSSGNRRILLVTYADGARFEKTQQLLHDSLQVAEIDDHWRWNRSFFTEDPVHKSWHVRNSKTNFRRGGAWKPYIIWQALRRVRWGDWLVYHDASQYVQQGFTSSLQPLLAWLERQKAVNPCQCLGPVRLRQSMQHEWESRCTAPYGPEPRDYGRAKEIFCGTLWRIGACTPSIIDCCERLWHQPMLQHAWSVWRKTRRSARFLNEWVKYSSDYDAVAYAPFVDQSMNGLLTYKWSQPVLWLPKLYRQAWSQDLDLAAGSMGRNDGLVFKHLNFILDALYNQLAAGKDQGDELELVDPWQILAQDTQIVWTEKAAGPRSWQRSLCLFPEGRPRKAMTVLGLRLFLEFPDDLQQWGVRYKRPIAWNYELRERSSGSGVLDAAFVRLPGDITTVAGGEEFLFTQGFSTAFSLGAWRLRYLHPMHGQDSLKVLAHIELLNDGTIAWQARSPLKLIRGNVSMEASAELCGGPEGDAGEQRMVECHDVAPGETLVTLLTFSIPWLPAGRSRLGLTAGIVQWAFHDLDGRPFGALLQATIDPAW